MQSSGWCATMLMLLFCLKFFPLLSPCNLVLEQHNVSACFCDIRHSLSKWCVLVRAFPFSSVWSGVHGGGVAEGVERAVEVGLQWAQNTLQHQRHQRVSSAHQTVLSMWTHWAHNLTKQRKISYVHFIISFMCFPDSGIYYQLIKYHPHNKSLTNVDFAWFCLTQFTIDSDNNLSLYKNSVLFEKKKQNKTLISVLS